MDPALFKTAFSANAIYIPASEVDTSACVASPAATAFVAALVKTGYTVDEKLFHALSHLDKDRIAEINLEVEKLLGLHLNWMPMIKDWKTPTGVDFYDSLEAILANIVPELKNRPGTTLPCGHFIPDDTFPLERYNGCPLCGEVFATTDWTYTGQGSKFKILTLWTEDNLRAYERTLLESKLPLEGAAVASLKTLLAAFGLPDGAVISIRENAALAFLALVSAGRYDQASSLIRTPADLLRALWYEKSGVSRIVRPKILADRAADSVGYPWADDYHARRDARRQEYSENLKLKYGRGMCRFVASLFENMPMSAEEMCENMNPHRNMWVRFIRALRLAEYARKDKYAKLREVLDRFYRSDYEVWAGEVETAVLAKDSDRALALLKERPGAFARSLFATMLHLGSAPVLEAFSQIVDRIELRLVLTLDMYADYCFDPEAERSVRIAGGTTHVLPPNRNLADKSAEQLAGMIAGVKALCAGAIRRRFASRGIIGGSVYIDKALFSIPMPIGERSQSDSGNDYLPQGARIDLEGDNVRLFLHWGEGLPAQHLDMDLSAVIVYPDHSDECAYYNLNPFGAIHSGDIQRIPDKVGAAEYIELDVPALAGAGAVYVAFLVSAYTAGGVAPSVVVGWMDSRYPMKVDNETGVAFDPSTVQFSTHMNSETLFKTMVFGVLDIARRQVIWVEMLLKGQTAAELDPAQIMQQIRKLERRISVGEILAIRAEAQGQTRVDDPAEADEVFAARGTDISRVANLL